MLIVSQQFLDWAVHCQRIVCVLFCAAIITSVEAAASNIPWDDDISYSRTSSGEDLRDVLRGVLSANSLSVVFKDDLNQVVSGHFEAMSPRKIFLQLVRQYDLDYQYDAQTGVVLVRSLSADLPENIDRDFLSLGGLQFKDLSEVLEGFGLGTRGLSFDESSGLLAVSGSSERVEQITDLIATLESHRSSPLGLTNVNSTSAEKEVHQWKDESVIDIANARVKVIPLRFAQVGPTTKSISGQSIVVPGIIDTLESLLGYSMVHPADRQAIRDMHASDNGARGSASAFPMLSEGRVSIDARTNSVVVWGSARFILEVERLIEKLDVPQPMVLIEVIIARVEVGTAQELGVAFRSSLTGHAGDPFSGAVDTGTLGGSVTIESDVFTTTGLDAITLLPTGSVSGSTIASFVFRGSQGFLQAQLKALSDQNRATVLSAPRLVTMDNTTARISRSQNIFVQVDTGSENGEVGLEEVRTGLTLEITPSVVAAQSSAEDSLVRLSINAVNSAPGSGAFGQIDVIAQEVQTNVMVPDGATYVVGGLFDDIQIQRETGVPGLKDIWGLGRLFRTDGGSNTLGETVFFITPHIVEQSMVADGDVAVLLSSSEYLSRQRQRLRESREELLGVPGVRVHGVGALEEDE